MSQNEKRIDETSNGETVTQTITDEQAESRSKTFDIREKRLNIVFKLIYVIAAGTAAFFLAVTEQQGKGITTSYIAEFVITAFLAFLLIRMVIYVFNELKCLKLNNQDIPKEQIEHTEFAYSQIFRFFERGAYFGAFLIFILSFIEQYLGKGSLIIAIMVFTVNASVLGNMLSEKHKDLVYTISDISWMIVITLFLYCIGIGV